MKSIAFSCIAALMACGGSHERHPPPPDAPDPLDRQAELAVQANHLLGAVVAVEHDGRVLLVKAYGFADLARTRRLSVGDELPIGSLTKQVTAAALLQLVDDGKVALDAPVSTYVPAVTAHVTIRQLLNQTSGLPDYATALNLGRSHDQLLAIIGAYTPAFEPGTRYAYSNTNYWLLARVIEHASGRAYPDQLRERVLAPAGMTAHPCHAPAHVDGSHVDADGSAPIAWTAFDIEGYDGAGMLCATAADLLRWNDALYGGKLVSPASLAVMTTPPALPAGAPTQYGAGLIVATLHGKPMYLHTGAVTGGFESELVELPADHISVAILTNTQHPIELAVAQTFAIDLANSVLSRP